MKWCQRCVLPDTRPHLRLDAEGVCNACRNHASRASIDWDVRDRLFADVAARAKSVGARYDCLIPVSGGKDSHWQVLTCLERGLHPLTVTWRPPARTDVGQRNLENLIGLGVDHIDFTVNPDVEARFMLMAFERLGDPAIPMHLGLFNIPLTLACTLRIPLVVWGENSAFEYGEAEQAHTGFTLDESWLRSYGVSGGTTWHDWVTPELSAESLTPYRGPTAADLEDAGVAAVFLGYYVPWDPELTLRAAEDHGFTRSSTGPKTGLYDYADIDDHFIAVHHHLKWYKFGFTRLFDNLSLEIRNGRVSRGEAIEIIKRHGADEPTQDIERFCAFTDISRTQYEAIVERWRNPDVWSRNADGTWIIESFLIDDWAWS